jgi:hypothetical protein
MSLVLDFLKEPEEAEQRLEEAVETCDKHPGTLNSMINASTYRTKERFKEAKELQVPMAKIVERILGEDHPSTLTIIGNLALTFWKIRAFKQLGNSGV